MSSTLHRWYLLLICCSVYDLYLAEKEDSYGSNLGRTFNTSDIEEPARDSLNCSKTDKPIRDGGQGEIETGNLPGNSTFGSGSDSQPTDHENGRIITSGEIHRQRIIVSGYLIIAVVLVGLAFMGITHYLGRREVRKYKHKYRLSYRSVTRKELEAVAAV